MRGGEPAWQDHRHAAIREVGLPDRRRLTVDQVLTWMSNGDTFYTQGSSGVKADVERYGCAQCGRHRIRSVGDAVKDNNLDSLPQCP